MTTTLKEFLAACENLGTLRLIVTSSAAVLEARGKLEKLFYAELPKGKYANMHTEGFEFHLNMDKIIQVKFETGEAKRGNFTTYAIRFLDDKQEPALSLFLQWGKPGEYEPGQVENWQTLKEKYGEIWQPLPAEI
ncbi:MULTISPECIES: ChuX/HutX family heme-like substrate-binding protein [Nostoc]|uniref:Heme utilization protein HuvX n=1 Tax=Nostoc paludosum FACHB-159 TaxID=2692908 RepID=A0ABR8K951_9NOSO|nr:MULTISPECIES: ChuX/HutX family heme-like substrate-binding protein [Nostoc]MBD2678871.1 heme utilization protein HuvX [Nostoc sp. FACHB-857]MBD2735249.1 heme utilization protein HuvX [Nostoc paludosum FACHB-159]